MNQILHRVTPPTRISLRKITLLLLLLGLFFQTQAQRNYYYYYGDQKVDLELSDQYIYVTLQGSQRSAADLNTALGDKFDVIQLDRDQSISSLRPVAGTSVSEGRDWAILQLRQSLGFKDYLNRVEGLKSESTVNWASPFFKLGDDDMVGLSQYFYVKLRQKEDLQLLREQCKGNGAQIVGQNKYMPLWYTLQVDQRGDKNALDLANLFYESGLFEFSEPSLMVGNFGLSANDPLFADQWGLEHTGQNGWTTGTDMRACDAWETTQGSREIVVAVLDDGIELNHPDLVQNIWPQSYNTITASSPSSVYGGHGTACGGIVAAARDNNRGVSGIAPNVRLMSISHTLTFTPNVRQELADGINWAWMNGADVISNSWGSNALSSAFIDNAITAALNSGRGGLGTVVVFAAGNSNSSVIYPASSNADIVAVAAMSPCAERKSPTSCDLELWGSSFGSQIDVMAPGVKISTTDRQGTAGYDPGDYTPDFNGTSSACPAVAGIAGLILSINSCLDHDEVEDMLEENARKVGGYAYATTAGRPNGTWFNETGYGLVDADACVAAAVATLPATGGNFDLIVRDRPFDIGLEPNPDTGPMWISEDIWIRQDLDGLTGHENPEYKMFSPNGVYVRVTNIGTVTSPCATLAVYFSKASTGLVWPVHWDNYTIGSVLHGDLINTVTIPPIGPGGTYIAEIPWYPPNPADFSTDIHHFCLAARILSPADPMFNEQTGIGISPNVRRNNNIAWKNVSVFNATLGNSPGASVFIRGNFLEPVMVDLHFHDLGFEEQIDRPFFDRGGQVFIQTDPDLFEAFLNAELMGVERIDANTFQLNNRNARINNLFLPMGANYAATFSFELPDIAEGEQVVLDLIQETAGTGRAEGGERFVFAPGGVSNLGGGGPSLSLRQQDLTPTFLAPNPVEDLLTMTYDIGNQDARVSWRILDLSGRQVLGADLGEQPGNGRYTETIDVALLNAGVYLVELRIGKELLTEKLLVK
ncbi:MAG: S8 family serine peptidase [Bacteroidota bacterium]